MKFVIALTCILGSYTSLIIPIFLFVRMPTSVVIVFVITILWMIIAGYYGAKLGKEEGERINKKYRRLLDNEIFI